MARSMAQYPPGKGGGEEVAYGYKGKGILIHTLTDGNGMPLANCTTPANGSELSQVMPLLNSVTVKTNARAQTSKTGQSAGGRYWLRLQGIACSFT